VVILKAFVLEILKVVLVVKHLISHHDEARIVTTSHTNVVQVVKTHTELRAHQGVGGRVKFTSDTVRLETENTSSNVVYIIAPSSNNRVSLDSCAWHFLLRETVPESLPALSVGELLSRFA